MRFKPRDFVGTERLRAAFVRADKLVGDSEPDIGSTTYIQNIRATSEQRLQKDKTHIQRYNLKGDVLPSRLKR